MRKFLENVKFCEIESFGAKIFAKVVENIYYFLGSSPILSVSAKIIKIFAKKLIYSSFRAHFFLSIALLMSKRLTPQNRICIKIGQIQIHLLCTKLCLASPQISTKYCTTLSQNSPKICLLNAIFVWGKSMHFRI
jgi:hypothetical protein